MDIKINWQNGVTYCDKFVITSENRQVKDYKLNNNFSDMATCNQIAMSTFSIETKKELAISEWISALETTIPKIETVVNLIVEGIPYVDGKIFRQPYP